MSFLYISHHTKFFAVRTSDAPNDTRFLLFHYYVVPNDFSVLCLYIRTVLHFLSRYPLLSSLLLSIFDENFIIVLLSLIFLPHSNLRLHIDNENITAVFVQIIIRFYRYEEFTIIWSENTVPLSYVFNWSYDTWRYNARFYSFKITNVYFFGSIVKSFRLLGNETKSREFRNELLVEISFWNFNS